LLVKVINIDPSGKVRLSRKALLIEEGGEAAQAAAQAAEAGEGRGESSGRPGGGRHGRSSHGRDRDRGSH
jgi:polyribonucleotide nucleotidyltransferase